MTKQETIDALRAQIFGLALRAEMAEAIVKHFMPQYEGLLAIKVRTPAQQREVRALYYYAVEQGRNAKSDREEIAQLESAISLLETLP